MTTMRVDAAEMLRGMKSVWRMIDLPKEAPEDAFVRFFVTQAAVVILGRSRQAFAAYTVELDRSTTTPGLFDLTLDQCKAIVALFGPLVKAQEKAKDADAHPPIVMAVSADQRGVRVEEASGEVSEETILLPASGWVSPDGTLPSDYAMKAMNLVRGVVELEATPITGRVVVQSTLLANLLASCKDAEVGGVALRRLGDWCVTSVPRFIAGVRLVELRVDKEFSMSIDERGQLEWKLLVRPITDGDFS